MALAMLCFMQPSFSVSEEPIEFDADTHVLFGGTSKKEIYSLNNYSTPVQTSGASVDVITREDIQNQNNPDISHLLNQTMGVTYGQGNGGYGQPSKLIIRGTDRVLFTIDGVRVDSPTSINRVSNLSNYLLTDDIEKMEIIRGPHGTVAGHNSLGGMLAMRTRRGSGKLQMEAQSLFGGYGTFKERFAIMGGGEKFDHYTAINWFKTDDGSYFEHHKRFGDNAYNNLSLVGNYGIRFLDGKAELRDVIRYNRGRKNIQMDVTNTTPYGPDVYTDQYAITQDFSNSLAWTHNVNKKYNYDITTTYFNNNYNINYRDVNQYTKMNGARFDIGTQHNYKIFDWNTLSAGYKFGVENYYYDSNYWGSYHKRDHNFQHDVFLNDSINIKDILFIRGGARYSYNSAYGGWVSPNASAALVLPTFKLNGAKTTFRGSWGMNKYTPSLYQRYGDGASMWPTLPNNNLKPEDANSWDAGINQSFMDGKLTFDFGFFQSNYRNFIDYDYDWMSGTGMYVNRNSARIQGYEGKVTWTPNDKFKVVVNYTYTDALDKDNHRQIDLIARNRINGTLIWTPVERFSAYIGVEGGTDRTAAAGTVKLPGYIDANIGARVRLFTVKGVSTYLQGDIYNLFNQKIACGYYGSSYTGYGRIYTPGINFRLGLFVKYNLPEKEKL